MKKPDITEFLTENVTREPIGDGARFCFGIGGGRLTLDDFAAYDGKWLVLDLTNELDISAGITWRFEAEDGRFIAFKMGLLPQLKTRIALPFSVLDGRILFLPRTPGKLKTVTQGRPLPIADVRRFSIFAGDSRREMRLIIHDMYISDAEPDYPLPDVRMVDKLGQKLCTDWEGKTRSEEELRRYIRSELSRADSVKPLPRRSRFGGFSELRFNEGSGRFALHNDGRRWWMVDPEGYAFFSMGLDCVTIDGDCNLTGITKLCEELPPRGSVGWRDDKSEFFSFHKSNLYRALGDEWYDGWSRLTRARMEEWGFNTIACWSDLRHARASKQPYTFIFGGRPLTKRRIFRDFPDVFAPEYSEVCAEWAKQILDFKDDEYLLGYFMGNEPEWAFVNDLNLAALLLEGGEGTVSRARLIEYLRGLYGDISNLNAAWGSDFESYEALTAPKGSERATADLWRFTAEMIREYMRVPSEAIRALDPGHLNLGIRYAWLSSEVLASGSEYVDIFSFNCYQMDPTPSLDNFYAKVKKPLMIGEFHFGALDVGLDATGLRGVPTQHDRGVAYRRYMQRAAAHPMCVGAHYFTLNDQAYLGRFDGENYQIGVVDCCQKPYAGFVEGIIKTHSELYRVASGELEADAPAAPEIPAIAF